MYTVFNVVNVYYVLYELEIDRFTALIYIIVYEASKNRFTLVKHFLILP